MRGFTGGTDGQCPGKRKQGRGARKIDEFLTYLYPHSRQTKNRNIQNFSRRMPQQSFWAAWAAYGNG